MWTAVNGRDIQPHSLEICLYLLTIASFPLKAIACQVIFQLSCWNPFAQPTKLQYRRSTKSVGIRRVKSSVSCIDLNGRTLVVTYYAQVSLTLLIICILTWSWGHVLKMIAIMIVYMIAIQATLISKWIWATKAVINTQQLSSLKCYNSFASCFCFFLFSLFCLICCSPVTFQLYT